MAESLNMTVKEAAEIMDVSPMFVYIGLQSGRLPFGSAIKNSSTWTYHISRAAFEHYMAFGIPSGERREPT